MKKRVLVVDDDAAVRQSLKRVLEWAGYEVAAAADGEQAIVQFAPERVDMVLLDLNLPSASGWDIFERLTTRCPCVPIIIITGLTDQHRTARAAGAGALLEKPVEAAALLKTMEQLLAEPEDARLRRMCGYQDDTKYVRAANRSAHETARAPIHEVRRRPRSLSLSRRRNE